MLIAKYRKTEHETAWVKWLTAYFQRKEGLTPVDSWAGDQTLDKAVQLGFTDFRETTPAPNPPGIDGRRPPKLTQEDFCRAAKLLRCGVAEIKAVAEVESRGEGFYEDGFPVILFERHKFRDFTNGRYNKTHPHLSGPAGNYGKAGQNQRNKFNEAFALNPDAAMKACSWGKFQIMGFNYEVCGYQTVGAFVNAMKESEGKHLDAFCKFIIGNGLAAALRNRAWATLARGYNGPEFAKNKYHIKMAVAYAKFAKENIDC